LTTFLKDYAKNGGQQQMQGVWFGSITLSPRSTKS
jgi:hypothetical protein